MNRVILVGNLVRDPEEKITSTGKTISNFTIAVNDAYDRTQTNNFIRCVAWNSNATYINQYLVKGEKVAIEGKISTRSYVDNSGKTIYITEILVDQVEGMGRRKSNNETKDWVNVDSAMGSYSSVNTDSAFSPSQVKTDLQKNQTIETSLNESEDDDDPINWLDFNDLE